jgi:FlaA1/EpsC-like NDP-sugar epimerase
MEGMKVTVTGSDGFLGRRIMGLLERAGAVTDGYDLPRSVLDPDVTAGMDADWCLHLAAHKYATTAEEIPASVAALNIAGTQNVCDAFGPRVVLVSTCKAADPMTVYGASKMIAERIVLNAGGRVIRLVNVLGSVGSVIPLWDAQDGPMAVTTCERMWMTPEEAVRSIVAPIGWPTGRYALDVGDPEPVAALARRVFPGRDIVMRAPRRGDRVRERLVAEYETASEWIDGVLRITHPADA